MPPPLQECMRRRASVARPVLHPICCLSFPVLPARTCCPPPPPAPVLVAYKLGTCGDTVPPNRLCAQLLWMTFSSACIITDWSLLLWPVPRPQGSKLREPSHETGECKASSSNRNCLGGPTTPHCDFDQNPGLVCEEVGIMTFRTK